MRDLSVEEFQVTQHRLNKKQLGRDLLYNARVRRRLTELLLSLLDNHRQRAGKSLPNVIQKRFGSRTMNSRMR